VDRAITGVADDLSPAHVERPAAEPIGVQGWRGGMFELASGRPT